MAEPGALADGIVNAMAAMSFLWVGAALAKREVSPEARPAAWGFAGFWLLYGINLGFSAWRVLRVALGYEELLPFVVLFVVETGVAVLALYGLFLHLLFLVRGSYRGHEWILFAVWAVAIIMGAIVVAHQPASVVVEDWRTNLEFGIELHPAIRWGMVATYYGALLFVAGKVAWIARNSARNPRRRAIGVAVALGLLAAMDALILGPDQAIPFGYLATFGKLVAVAIVAKLYLRPQNEHLRTTETPHS